MLLPKGGVTWKSAKAQLPPTRAIWVFLTRTRFLLCVALAGIVLLLWRGVSTSASEMQRLDAVSLLILIAPIGRRLIIMAMSQILLLGAFKTANADDAERGSRLERAFTNSSHFQSPRAIGDKLVHDSTGRPQPHFIDPKGSTE